MIDLQIVYEHLMNVILRTEESENFLTTDSVNVIEDMFLQVGVRIQ